MVDLMPVLSGACSCSAQVELQKQNHIKLDAQLRLRYERQRQLDHLEEEYHRKRSEINRRYNELLHAAEQNKEPALMLLASKDAAFGGHIGTIQFNAMEPGVPNGTPAAAAASHDHQVLLSNGPLRGAAKSDAHADANGSPDQPRHDGSTSHHEEATAMETEQGHAECDAGEVVPDSEDEESPQEKFDQLHACDLKSAQPERLQSNSAASIADGRGDRNVQDSGQSGTMEGPEGKAVSASEPEVQFGMSTGAEAKQKERVKGRLGDTFYMHREPRSAPEASGFLDVLHASIMCRKWLHVDHVETMIAEVMKTVRILRSGPPDEGFTYIETSQASSALKTCIWSSAILLLYSRCDSRGVLYQRMACVQGKGIARGRASCGRSWEWSRHSSRLLSQRMHWPHGAPNSRLSGPMWRTSLRMTTAPTGNTSSHPNVCICIQDVLHVSW